MASARPETSCVVTTQNFLVRNISIRGLQMGLSDHGRMMSEVHRAMRASSMPRPRNISVETMLTMMNGSPMAK